MLRRDIIAGFVIATALMLVGTAVSWRSISHRTQPKMDTFLKEGDAPACVSVPFEKATIYRGKWTVGFEHSGFTSDDYAVVGFWINPEEMTLPAKNHTYGKWIETWRIEIWGRKTSATCIGGHAGMSNGEIQVVKTLSAKLIPDGL